MFFSENWEGLDEIVNRDIYLYGDFNIDLIYPDQKQKTFFFVLKDTYDVKNLIQVPACFKNVKGTL